MDTLPRLIANIELPIDDDLHFVVRVRVHEGGPLLETVQPAGDGFLAVGGREDVAEEGVFVGDEWGLEFGLCARVVGEGGGGGHFVGGDGGGGGGSRFDFTEEGAHS